MRIAIPVSQGKLAAHFGHCEGFELIDADAETKQIQARETVTSPAHQPGLLPKWLAEQGAEVILAGGIGSRAIQLFTEHGIKVVVGVPPEDLEALVVAYLEGNLQSKDNACDH